MRIIPNLQVIYPHFDGLSDNSVLQKVVDVYLGWAGPCEMMFPTYKTLANTTDEFESRLEFLLVSS